MESEPLVKGQEPVPVSALSDQDKVARFWLEQGDLKKMRQRIEAMELMSSVRIYRENIALYRRALTVEEAKEPQPTPENPPTDMPTGLRQVH